MVSIDDLTPSWEKPAGTGYLKISPAGRKIRAYILLYHNISPVTMRKRKNFWNGQFSPNDDKSACKAFYNRKERDWKKQKPVLTVRFERMNGNREKIHNFPLFHIDF